MNGKKRFKFTDLSDDLLLNEEINTIDNSQFIKIENENLENNENNILESFVLKNNLEKNDQLNNEIKNNDFVIKNNSTIQPTPILKNNSNQNNNLKTFNQFVENKENTSINDNFEFNKSNNLFSSFIESKEKLDVKTNIYLKQNLVNQILYICKQTGQSRSSIINKLIEHALNDIQKK